VAETWSAASGDNRVRELIDPYNGLEMSRPASSSLVAQARFAAVGQIGTIELFGGVYATAVFPFLLKPFQGLMARQVLLRQAASPLSAIIPANIHGAANPGQG
jgi:hypothetical protein